MSTPQRVRVGVVGAGLMGRELAGLVGRWSSLVDPPVVPVLTAVCDVSEQARAWFDRVGSVTTTTGDYRDLLGRSGPRAVDVLYLAVPHHLHEQLYLDVADAGVDFLGEKPFGIDPAAAGNLVGRIGTSGVFARCSSEMPFFPGAQRAVRLVRSGALGRLVDARFSFLHSSDLDTAKPSGWKRRTETCGQIGVMGDLGMHVAHVPLRLGWEPTSVFAQLQDLVATRPDGHGGTVPCDTVDNAVLVCRALNGEGGEEFPMVLETKRIAPGEMNTWSMRVVGMTGGVEFSTRNPQLLRVMTVVDGDQVWQEVQVGSQSTHPTITGGIFEFGFADALLQMWASYLAERAGGLGDRFGCATPEEALASHRVFDAALVSSAEGRAVAPVPATGPLRRHVADDVRGVIGRTG